MMTAEMVVHVLQLGPTTPVIPIDMIRIRETANTVMFVEWQIGQVSINILLHNVGMFIMITIIIESKKETCVCFESLCFREVNSMFTTFLISECTLQTHLNK